MRYRYITVVCGGREASAPINVAIGLGMYAAERMKGAFKNHYISFASRPQLIEIQGVDFVDKVKRIYDTNLCDNTNLEAVFDLLYNEVISGRANATDLPKTLVILSDMEIDDATESGGWWSRQPVSYAQWTTKNAKTMMEKIREKWAASGLVLPNLVYWNIEARQNTVLDLGPNVTLCGGASAILFEQIVRGVKGIDIMYEKLNSKRYLQIII